MSRLPCCLPCLLLLAAGCSDDTAVKPIDAAPQEDAPIDALCGTGQFYTGEYVDWDSSDAVFLGIFNATWAVQDDTLAHASDKTPPNGRFSLCVAGNPTTTITPDPTDTGSNGSDTYLPGVAIGKHSQIAAGVLTSTRSMRLSRVTTFFQGVGESYDPTAGQLFVHVTGSPGELAVSDAHANGLAQAYGASGAWGVGDIGTYVFFPNIAITGASPTVTLTAVQPTADGTGAIPIRAGVITYVEVSI